MTREQTTPEPVVFATQYRIEHPPSKDRDPDTPFAVAVAEPMEDGVRWRVDFNPGGSIPVAAKRRPLRATFVYKDLDTAREEMRTGVVRIYRALIQHRDALLRIEEAVAYGGSAAVSVEDPE